MEYRGDEVALKNQCQALESEIAPLKEELARLEQQERVLNKRLSRARKRRRLRLLAALFLGRRVKPAAMDWDKEVGMEGEEGEEPRDE